MQLNNQMKMNLFATSIKLFILAGELILKKSFETKQLLTWTN
jgi:hypothetical protein